MEDRLLGTLLGTAVGDALGLATEGMSARAIARRFGRVERFHVLGGIGFVSDDTELSALVAASLARHPHDRDACVRAFRFALLGWFLRLPFGIGLATLRACVKIALGFRTSGVGSAGNGAAMRASIVGVFFRDDEAKRRAWSDAIARVTHTDPRAVEGARFVAELSARCAVSVPDAERRALVLRALDVVDAPQLRAAIELAVDLAESDATLDAAATALGTTGFVVHSVPLAVFAFLRHGDDPKETWVQTVAAGGDTDTNAAIAGAWVGALHGAAALPSDLVNRLQRGPFGREHLRELARALAAAHAGERVELPHPALAIAMARNLALFPVVLVHAVHVAVSRWWV